MATPLTTKQIIINGQLINYFERVGNTGPTVLFLHGWQSQASVFFKILDKLSDVNIFALDFPGFGKSPAPVKAFFVSDYVGVVSEFIQKLGLKNVILVGHSFGGRVGIKLASENSNLISKLILVDAAGKKDESMWKGFKSFMAHLLHPLFALSFMQPLRRWIYGLLGATDYVELSGIMRQTFLNTINEDLLGNARQVKVPTLLIWGRNDLDTPLELGKVFNRLIPQSRLEILEDAGHFSFLDQPEKFTQLTSNFIKWK